MRVERPLICTMELVDFIGRMRIPVREAFSYAVSRMKMPPEWESASSLFTDIIQVLYIFPYRPTYFISAPNVIRVGVNETILINIFGSGVNAGGVSVTVRLQDYPARSITFASQTVNVMRSKNYITFNKDQIPT